MPESADSEHQQPAAAAFDAALDHVLRAWAEGREIASEEIARVHPDLGGEVDAVFGLAREIALLRPVVKPHVPGYRVLGELGRGGMGIVYAAQQEGLNRRVALKVLAAAAGLADSGRRRFLTEARSLGRVRHPHVVTVFEVIEAAELCAYAMEWIDGKSLGDLLGELAGWPRRGPAPAVVFGPAGGAALPSDPTVWFVRLGIAIARALGEVHRHGLVHRDVKPGNVLLRADGTALLSDFGVVRDELAGLTRTGQMVGTPTFAPPEQLRGELERVGPASDVYSLGAMLHCAFAGVVPFAGRTPAELVVNIEAGRRRPLWALGLPRELETIVGKCLEPAPDDRYASADAVADDLENLLALRPIQARPVGIWGRAVRLLRRNRRTVAVAVVTGVVVLAVCAAVASWVFGALTLPARVEAAVREARLLLLEPTHEEQVELTDQGEPVSSGSVFAARSAAAIEAYDLAIALAPARGDLQFEREVTAAAQAILGGRSFVPSAQLAQFAPATCAAMAEWGRGEWGSRDLEDAARADRRLLGQLAFLLGRAAECHAAWATMDLARTPDPFVDAAAGQMHRAREEMAKAYPRLLRALDAWPEVGFLAVGLADCAVQLGDLEAGDRYLTIAEGLSHKDTFDTHVRVRADLRAAQGRVPEARADYEWMLEHHRTTSARVHYASMLEREGNLGRAIDLYLHLVERGGAVAKRHARRLGELVRAWWAASTYEDHAADFLFAWQAVEPKNLRVARLSATRTLWSAGFRAESGTLGQADSSGRLHQALPADIFLFMDLTSMTTQQARAMRNVPNRLLRTAAGIAALACSPAMGTLGKRWPLSWFALCKCAGHSSTRTTLVAILGGIVAAVVPVQTAPAQAPGPTTVIDFETYPGGVSVVPGTFLSTQYQSAGVVFEPHWTARGHATRVVQESPGEIANFGNTSSRLMDVGDYTEWTTIRFVDPLSGSPRAVQYVSFKLGDGHPDSETFDVHAYDTAGVLLSASSPTTTTGAFVFTLAATNIGRVDVGLHPYPSSLSGGGLDDLVFSAASAPPPGPTTVIDFETYPGGANVVPGTFLSTEYQSVGVVFVPHWVARGHATRVVQEGTLGVQNFGNSPSRVMDVGDYTEWVTIRFVDPTSGSARPVQYVSFMLGDGDPDSERFTISAYDTSGVLLASGSPTTTTGAFVFTLAGANIGSVDVGLSPYPSSPSGGALDDLVFSAAAVPDSDGDGLTNDVEALLGTNPADPDTDDDGLLDGTEVDMAMGSGCPNPLVADSDGDGLLDGAEVALGTNPCNPDSDSDGVPDGVDPLPTIPGVTTGYLEERIRLLSLAVSTTDLARFDAPNQNAREGRRNSLANRVGNAANAVASGDRAGAITLLEGVLQRVDGVTPPPDWMLASAEQQMMFAEIQLLLSLLRI